MKIGNRGFVKIIVLIVVALVILGFFGFNLKEIVNSPTVRANLAYLWSIVTTVWQWIVAHLKALI